jgi:peptidoglycan-associated lipoprotein
LPELKKCGPKKLLLQITGFFREKTVKRNYSKYLASSVTIAAILILGGCHKKAAPPPPPPAPPPAPAPTAQITATPSSVNPGDKVVVTWQTTNASDVSIEGSGPVSPSGTQTVTPSESTTYHLIARGDGGSTDATARVTVTQPALAPVQNAAPEAIDDATFHQNVQDIFFDYDSYDLNSQAQPIAAKDAAYLAAHPELRVVIGGYCDERGSAEYNLGLGENRANAAKQALVSSGVSPDRIRTVSYGKEKPFCSEHSESCWQQNRRAQFSLDR